jgi:hypothetical protein
MRKGKCEKGNAKREMRKGKCEIRNAKFEIRNARMSDIQEIRTISNFAFPISHFAFRIYFWGCVN